MKREEDKMPKSKGAQKYNSMEEYKKRFFPKETIGETEEIEKPYEYGGKIATESIEKNKSILKQS